MSESIVILDGYTLNPGDLSWGPLEQLGTVTVHERTPAERIVERASNGAIVLTNKTPLSAETIAQLPKLRYIGVLATGYNIVDIGAAGRGGIPVTNIPTYGTGSVAQHAAALMLELARRVSIHHQAVRDGQWTGHDDWCFALAPIEELTGKTLGIIGLGRIGLALARIASAMDMHIIAHDATELTDAQRNGVPVTYKPMDDVFAEADVVSLHCPLTEQTHHLVNAERLATMKPTAFLINTSRGPLVDADALTDALRDDVIAGAALDVLDEEPPPEHNPLLSAPNCIITPHVAWYAKAARQRLLDTAVDNLRAFLDGKPINVVNP